MPLEKGNKAAFIFKAHQKAYLLNALGVVQKQGGSFPDSGVGNIFIQGFTRVILENTAQLFGGIAALLCHGLAG